MGENEPTNTEKPEIGIFNDKGHIRPKILKIMKGKNSSVLSDDQFDSIIDHLNNCPNCTQSFEQIPLEEISTFNKEGHIDPLSLLFTITEDKLNKDNKQRIIQHISKCRDCRHELNGLIILKLHQIQSENALRQFKWLSEKEIRKQSERLKLTLNRFLYIFKEVDKKRSQ